VGGAATIAKGLVPVIEAAGGSARAGTPVSEILLEDGKAVGVRTSSGEEFRAPAIVSAIGAGETVKHLLPEEIREGEWAREIATFKPSICHFDLLLGFEGDIARHGATRSNHWFYESWDTNDAIWSAADGVPIPMMFVSFSSLKDPAHDPGPLNRHTGDMLVWADWSYVAEFANGGAEARADEWAAFKQSIESRMMEFFENKFPALAPLVVYRELGTPFATASFTGHEKGGFYGVETTPRRMLSDALNARTPVPGLFLTGQDVMTPGIAGALAGGMFGAAAIDPRVFQKLR
jgi:all-trans-retinol 13,14-reductase